MHCGRVPQCVLMIALGAGDRGVTTLTQRRDVSNPARSSKRGGSMTTVILCDKEDTYHVAEHCDRGQHGAFYLCTWTFLDGEVICTHYPVSAPNNAVARLTADTKQLTRRGYALIEVCA